MEEEIETIAKRMEEEMVISLSEAALDEADRVFEYVVVAKVCGGEIPSREGFAGLLMKLWKPSEGVEFKGLSEDLMVVVFAKKEEMVRVLGGGPWVFNDWAILVDEWKSDRMASEATLSTFRMWIQLHNLPLGYTKGKPLMDVAEAIGNVIQVQEPAPPRKGLVAPVKYVRMFVKIDVSTPAKYGFYVKRRSGDPVWVDVKYERMPRMCYRCGRWNHEEDSCLEKPTVGKPRYGPWLRSDYITSRSTSKDIMGGGSEGMCSGLQQGKALGGEIVLRETCSSSSFHRDGYIDGEEFVSKQRAVEGNVDVMHDDVAGGRGDMQLASNVVGVGVGQLIREGGIKERGDGDKGKKAVGVEMEQVDATLLTEVHVGYASQFDMGCGDWGKAAGFSVMELQSGIQEQGMKRVEAEKGRKRKESKILGMKMERKKFKTVKSRCSAMKMADVAKEEVKALMGADGEEAGSSSVLLSAEVAMQPRREP